jgi:hypothetical protein
MAKGPMYVKDFDFSAKPCNYSHGGSAKAGQAVQMAKSNAVSKSLVGQKPTKMASGGYYAKGGIKEPATGEKYPSRSSMMKRESLETPRMQKDEVIQSRTVKAPMRRQMPVASAAPMIQAGGMKKGGFVKGGSGMVKTEGTLGIKGNKNPGERNGKPTTATKTGNVPFKSGGTVKKKYADGGPVAPTQTGALNQMAQQQRLSPSQIARQQAVAAQAAGRPLSQAQQMANLQAAMTQSQQQRQMPMPQQAPMGLGQAAMGGGMPSQQLQNLAQQMMRQGMPGGQQMPPQSMSQQAPQQAYQDLSRAYATLQGTPSAPSQQLASLAQQGMPQQAPMPPQGFGPGNPQQQQMMAVLAQQGIRPTGAPMPQQAPMGMGMGQFGQQQPQQPQRAQPMSQFRTSRGGF